MIRASGKDYVRERGHVVLYKLAMVFVPIFKALVSLPLPRFPSSSALFLRQAAFLSPAWNGMQRKREGRESTRRVGGVRVGFCTKLQFDSLEH